MQGTWLYSEWSECHNVAHSGPLGSSYRSLARLVTHGRRENATMSARLRLSPGLSVKYGKSLKFPRSHTQKNRNEIERVDFFSFPFFLSLNMGEHGR